MTFNILLYGATGHSGEAIVERAVKDGLGGCQLILAGRDRWRLAKAAMAHGLAFRAFALEDRRDVLRNLVGVDLVVNAAGPFSLTADRLAKAAIQAGCSYLDINGELDVYMKTDDLARQAARQGVALVSSVGHTAAASCLLLDLALKQLEDDGKKAERLSAIRMALSLPPEYSQGSAVTALRLVRDQVLTIRRGQARNAAGEKVDALVKWHEPAGRLDRTFDFGARRFDRDARTSRDGRRDGRGTVRMATAANMVDTMVALQLVERGEWKVDAIESYLQMDLPGRATYQAASTLSSLTILPPVSRMARAWARVLVAERPGAGPPEDEEQVVVLQIDDHLQQRLIEWRLTVPSAYGFTAQVVVALVKKLATQPVSAAGAVALEGWVTPSSLLAFRDAPHLTADLKGCRVEKRGADGKWT